MEKTKESTRRKFTPEFKADVVKLCKRGDRSAGAVARDLGLTESAVHKWVAQSDIDAGLRNGMTTADREEIVRLKKQVRVLTEERDILKRATVFFAKEIR